MKVKERKPKKYPNLWGCYVDGFFERMYTRKYLQARVNIQHYKGYMLLSVPSDTTNGSGVAWLDGDDIDTVIAMLRDAKRVWLKAYRKAERELARRERAKRKGCRK